LGREPDDDTGRLAAQVVCRWSNDVAALCETASRPTMRFIAVKLIEQKSMLCVHRLRMFTSYGHTVRLMAQHALHAD
jgi:hypothetical protein